MTSTNSKKSPVAYDPARHLYYAFDAQHEKVQFCALRNEKDHGEWVDTSDARKLTPDEILRGARKVLQDEPLDLLDIKTSCVMGVDDRMLRQARAKSKQLRWAFRNHRTTYVGRTE